MKVTPGGALITAAKNGYNTVLSNGYYWFDAQRG
jgi:hexosaminidase